MFLRTQRDLKRPGAEAGVAFFDNEDVASVWMRIQAFRKG